MQNHPETIPYQITGLLGADAAGAGDRGQLRHAFAEHLPHRPYCTDDLSAGLVHRLKPAALRCRFIELNNPATFKWMLFDVDRPGAYFADQDANLPRANVVAVNRANGHAHLDYLLATPVARHQMARLKPLEYFAAVQRGFTNRLGADKHFVGLMVKNPLHSEWLVEWRRDEPYTLDELADWLFDHDTRFDPRPEAQFGAGRNVTTFDDLRAFSYREVLKFKRARRDVTAFAARLEAVAIGINHQFQRPMAYSEVRAIAKSVARWTWRRFSPEQFSEIQRSRIARRWAGHTSVSSTMPWLDLGISRATWYRRQAAQGGESC